MKRETDQDAFSLVEVTIALAVASFCLLILVGLLPAGINMNHNSFAQTVGINLSTSIAADLTATPTNSTVSSIYSIPIAAPAASSSKTLYMQDNGSFGTTVPSGPYRVAVTTTGPSSTYVHAATTARILVTWPAPADPTKGTLGSVDTVISLNRN